MSEISFINHKICLFKKIVTMFFGPVYMKQAATPLEGLVLVAPNKVSTCCVLNSTTSFCLFLACKHVLDFQKRLATKKNQGKLFSHGSVI